jgi:uncharacterized Zn-finger protein
MENSYSCKYCQKIFSSSQSKCNHISIYHKTEKLNKNKINILNVKQTKNINNNVNTKLLIDTKNKNNFICQYCDKGFTLKSSLTRHMNCRCKIKNEIINKISIDPTFIQLNPPILDKPKENNDNTVITIKPEYIYLLQEREFKNNKQEIYKIGKTKQYNFRRFNDYPKDSLLILHILCDNCDISEKKLIELFNTKYIKRTDIGNEYFEGNYKNMISDIYINL